MVQYAKRYNRENLYIDAETETLLKQYQWPGNIRELENIIERAVLLSTGSRLDIDLPLTTSEIDQYSFADMPTLDELQQRYIGYVLEKTDGKISGPGSASEILGLKRTTLQAKMKKLKIR